MKIKWGVIGCGGIADRRTLPGMMLADNVELVAVMDANMDFALKAKEKYGAKYAFDKAEDLLALDEIEAVYIASPVAFHTEQTVMAAKAKKHILLEKPMTLTSEKSKELADVCAENGVKIGLVTSGLYQKAWPEILNAFQTLGMGDPKDFYDAIITAGTAIRKGQAGTLGEIEAKPHPWLYAETAMALGVDDKSKIVGIEDSAAGVMSIRLAGFAALGVAGGNLAPSGMLPFLYNRKENKSLMSLIPLILGE